MHTRRCSKRRIFRARSNAWFRRFSLVLSGAEIQANLRKFVAEWALYAGTERSEAQTFLNDLFECYGNNRKAAGALFEDSHTSAGIMDLFFPGVAIIEMKAPHRAEKLAEHRKQALDYWLHSSDSASDRPAPPYVVLCAFGRFEVWEPGKYPTEPRADFTLAELPDRYETLLFLAGVGHDPLFGTTNKELTTEAASTIGVLYRELKARDAAAPEEIQRFILQIVWCLFAEDLAMLEGHPVQRIIDTLLENPQLTSRALLGDMFDVLNDEDDYGRVGILAGTKYVNGSLFAKPAKVTLNHDELLLLREAARFDWKNVDPTIFGSLMEGCLGKEQRWKLGAHYTHESDIMKIVGPTIVRPWREQIDAAKTPAEARAVLDRLCTFRVLDPACGCGNFLYVAYRELRQLESECKRRIVALAGSTGHAAPPEPLPYYRLDNLHGIELEPITAFIARVTLWMGHKQMSDRFGPAEPVLPLVDMKSIEVGDALVKDWPTVDCIIGNPPFLGSQLVRGARGDAYVAMLKKTFNVGVKDYCVYWFRKAHDQLQPGQRAGLVGTNSVSQNKARSASLEYIDGNNGVITDAVSTQKWPGEAKVHVSLVNWVKRPEVVDQFILDGVVVAGITPELRTPERSTGHVATLKANKSHSFQGPIPVGEGFIVSDDEAAGLLALTDARYGDVVIPFVTSDDIAEDPAQQARRWIINFGIRPLEEAMQYPAALKIVRERVKPVRDANDDPGFRAFWWRFGRPRPKLRKAAEGKARFVVAVRHGKRFFATWIPVTTCPSDATVVFPFDDDFSMGVLCARAHIAWAWSRSSTLKADLRYTPTTVFETFPWPDSPTAHAAEAVAECSRRIVARREEICVSEQIGLTELYNRVEDGAYSDLPALHQKLDLAVADAYGWPPAVAHDDDAIVHLLLERNREISAGTRPYHPFETSAGSQRLSLT